MSDEIKVCDLWKIMNYSLCHLFLIMDFPEIDIVNGGLKS